MASAFEKVVLVTGASGEIGGSIVRRLSGDGFSIVVHYRRNKRKALELAKSLPKSNHFLVVRADLSSEREIKMMFREIKKKFGRLDVVVNNAGLNDSQVHFEKLTSKKFDEIVSSNFLSASLVTKFSIPILRKTSSSRIVFVSSIVSFVGSPNRAAYAASKGALISLSKSLALGLAPNILVNTVVPGYIDTRMIRASKSEPIEKRISRIPLKRLGRVDEVASVISFLCSEDSSYITGQAIHVNGGLFFP